MFNPKYFILYVVLQSHTKQVDSKYVRYVQHILGKVRTEERKKEYSSPCRTIVMPASPFHSNIKFWTYLIGEKGILS